MKYLGTRYVDFESVGSAKKVPGVILDFAKGAILDLTNALANFQLAGSDSAALGGDLAYQYGKNGTLAGNGLTAAQDVIGNAGFGTSAQALRPLDGLQTGAVRLSRGRRPP